VTRTEWATELMQECLTAAGADTEAGLLAGEILLSISPLPDEVEIEQEECDDDGNDPIPVDVSLGGFNPNEPRIPAGNIEGGEWTFENKKAAVVEATDKALGKTPPVATDSFKSKKEAVKKAAAKAMGKSENGARPQLTEDEESALEHYTASAWINDELRGLPLRPEATQFFTEERRNEVRRNLASVFSKAKPLLHPILVYRGKGFDTEEEMNKFLSDAKDAVSSGKEIIEKGYMSTSTDKGSTEGYKGNYGVSIEVEAKKGIDLKHYGAGGVGEFLLDHGSRFKVKTIKKGEDGKPVVVFVQVGDNRDKTLSMSFDTFLAYDIYNRQAQGILNRSLQVAKGLSAAARKDLAAALKKGATGSGEAIVKFIEKYRVQLAKILTQTQIASVLEGAREVADKVPTLTEFPGAIPPPPTMEPQKAIKLIERLEKLPPDEQAEDIYKLPPAEQVYVTQAIAVRAAPPPVIPPIVPQRVGGGEPEDIHFPIIDEAVRSLAERNVMDRQKYDALEASARAKAFTVANVQAEETLTKIRDSLAKNVEEGADYETWRKKVVEEVEPGTFMSDWHQETVFRTNVQTAFADGQEALLNHPLIRSGFPYRVYDAIHDDRVRHNHLALEKLGIQGTNVYRADDPVWHLFRPPWDYNDRCSATPITVRFASEKGIKEAQEWLESGVEPANKAFVPMPDFQPPPGFLRAVSSAPMSIQMSLQPMATFGFDPNEPRDEYGRWRSIGTRATREEVSKAHATLVERLRKLASSENVSIKQRQYLGQVKDFFLGYSKLPNKTANAHVFFDPSVTDSDAAADTEGKTIRIGPKAFGGKGTSGSLGDTFIHEVEHLHDEHSGHKRTEFTPRLRQMLRELDDPKEAINFLRRHSGESNASGYVGSWFLNHPGHELTEEERKFAIEEVIQKAKDIYSVSLSQNINKPEEETDTALLYGESEGWGSITQGSLDTAKEGKSKRMKVGRAKTGKGRRVKRSLFKKLRVKKKWTPAAALSVDAKGHQHKGKGLGGGQFTKTGGSTDLHTFSGEIKYLAHTAKADDKFYDNKVFISAVYKRYKHMKRSEITLEEFKKMLLEAHHQGLVELSRADMVQDMDETKVKESETVKDLGGGEWGTKPTFHFVTIAKKAALSIDVVEEPTLSIEISATSELPKKVNVTADWDDLKSVVVGVSNNDVLPAWYPSFTDPDGNEVAGPDTTGETKAKYDPEMQKKCIKQQDALCKLLDKEGVQVFRPPTLSPETAQSDPVGLSQAWMREIFMVFGNKIVVGQMRTPHRNKDVQAIEPLLQSIEQAGLATVHRLPACTFERNEDWEGDTRPFLEGGDTFRLGKDVLVTMSYLATSGTGYRWLSDLLAPDGIEVWPAYLTPKWEHGDYVFMPVREGLCISHLPAFVDGLLPTPCTDWDVVSITEDEANNKFAANGVVLRYNLVLMPAGCPRVVRALEKKGVDVIEIPYDGPMFWQGGLDCSMAELWRQKA